jgi:hypothetical protein
MIPILLEIRKKIRKTPPPLAMPRDKKLTRRSISLGKARFGKFRLD